MRRVAVIFANVLACCGAPEACEPRDERCELTREQSRVVGDCDMIVVFLYDPELGCCAPDSGCGCLDNDCGEFFRTSGECEAACDTDSLCQRQ